MKPLKGTRLKLVFEMAANQCNTLKAAQKASVKTEVCVVLTEVELACTLSSVSVNMSSAFHQKEFWEGE